MFGRKRAAVDALDLSAILAGVIKRHGWADDRAKQAETEYRQFLYLMMLHPGAMMVPWGDDLDLFWHEHLLHTKKYAEDCNKLFGRFIHHDPTISRDIHAELAAKRDTASAYMAAYGSQGHTDPSSWLLPTMVTLAAVTAMSPASAHENKRQASSSSCGASPAASCGSTGHAAASCSTSSSSCSGGTSCSSGGCGGH